MYACVFVQCLKISVKKTSRRSRSGKECARNTTLLSKRKVGICTVFGTFTSLVLLDLLFHVTVLFVCDCIEKVVLSFYHIKLF